MFFFMFFLSPCASANDTADKTYLRLRLTNLRHIKRENASKNVFDIVFANSRKQHVTIKKEIKRNNNRIDSISWHCYRINSRRQVRTTQLVLKQAGGRASERASEQTNGTDSARDRERARKERKSECAAEAIHIRIIGKCDCIGFHRKNGN